MADPRHAARRGRGAGAAASPGGRREYAAVVGLGRGCPSEADWRDAVAEAVVALRAGELDKVVLARAIEVTAESGLDARAIAARLATRFPACFTFLCDGLVGASPELLIRRLGRHAESLVLAGTVRRGASPDEDAALERELLGSAKDAAEHRMAADSVREVLGRGRRRRRGGRATAAVAAGQPQPPRHPRRCVAAGSRPRRRSRWPALLHPSAAVGGTPRADALRMITPARGGAARAICRADRLGRCQR